MNFLNMMIGVVIETMTAEHALAEQCEEDDVSMAAQKSEPRQILATYQQIEHLQNELSEIKALLQQKNSSS